MKLTKTKLSLEEGIKKEWIITNGIGGYSSSTVIGMNTRKYHGLLVAPLTPPARRFLILSKLDESVEIENKKYNLYTNMCHNYISEGYKYLQSFEKEFIPTFKYKVENALIEKYICMEHGKNTVCVLYKIKNNSKFNVKFTIAPIINFRDFHCMNTSHNFEVRQEIKEKKVRLIIDSNSETPVYLCCSDGNYIKHDNDKFYNMYYIEEEKRGFFPEEDHCVPGRYEISIKPETEKEISFITSLEENIEELNTKEVINKEIKRINKLAKETGLIASNEKGTLIKDFIIATDNFVVYRPSFRLHTIIAGYPWFLDWGRDALIAFEGLLLVTKRYKIAKEVILTLMRDIKFGLVPNGYSGFDNRPLYNSADASLLLFEQIYKYEKYTDDTEFIKEVYPTLEKIIESYKNGIDLDNNNIYLDTDNLLVSGTEHTQNTWMDAKYGDFVATPRNGKVVEINSLWYNCLKIMEEFSKKLKNTENAKYYNKMAKDTKTSFEKSFYNSKKKCLYDVVGDGKVRPNQLLSMSLTYPVIDPNSKIGEEILETVTKKLLNKYGLKTLAKGEKNYVDVYEGDGFKRDMSYHQGITWPWLLGLYYDTLKNKLKTNKTKKAKEEYQNFVESVKTTFSKSFYEDDCIGSISELYDSKAPHLPKGCFAQAWSVAEVFRIILEK